jgi:S-adenosylmethionine decarboxylase
MAKQMMKYPPGPVSTLGVHVLAEMWGASADLLNDAERIEEILGKAVIAGEATLINICVHQFAPHGVTGTVTLAESHICIHTWPEANYAAIDVFMCGRGDAHKALDYLKQVFSPGRVEIVELKRGVSPEGS